MLRIFGLGIVVAAAVAIMSGIISADEQDISAPCRS